MAIQGEACHWQQRSQCCQPLQEIPPSLCGCVTACFAFPSMQKEEMEFQPLEQIKENEEANHSTPLLGHLGRLLGVQSPSFSRSSSRMNLLRRRGDPTSPFSHYTYQDMGKSGSPCGINQPRGESQEQWDSEEGKLRELDAFMSTPFYERPGFYSAPQTPISSIPMIFPSRRQGRKKPPALSSIAACSTSLRDVIVNASPSRASDVDKSQSSLGSAARETFVWPTERSRGPDFMAVIVEEGKSSSREAATTGSPGARSTASNSPKFPFLAESPEHEKQGSFKNLKSSKASHPPWLNLESTASATPNSEHSSAFHTPSNKTPGGSTSLCFSFTPVTSPALERSHKGNLGPEARSLSLEDAASAPDQHPEVSRNMRDTGNGSTNPPAPKEPRRAESPSPNDSGISLAEGDYVGLMEVILEASESPGEEQMDQYS